MCKINESDLFLAQYKAISEQIIHWDTFFWNKSRFFLALEGITLLGIGMWIVDKLATNNGNPINFSQPIFPIFFSYFIKLFIIKILFNSITTLKYKLQICISNN